MAQDRVSFIPWPQAQCRAFEQDVLDAQAGRADTHHKRKWKAVFLDTPGKPLKKLGVGSGARLHLVGHGEIGEPYIAADHGTGLPNRTPTEIVDFMIAKGFSQTFLGTVVCDVCYSAIGDHRPPFAKLLARELFSRGFIGTAVLGYKGRLVPFYQKGIVGKKFGHRVVAGLTRDDGTYDYHKSSDAQERFFGFG